MAKHMACFSHIRKENALCILAFMLVFSVSIVASQELNQSAANSHVPGASLLKIAYNTVVSANPIILAIAGVILLVASTLARWVAIGLIIFAVIQLFFMLFL